MESTATSTPSATDKVEQEHAHAHEELQQDQINTADLPAAITEKGPELIDTPVPLLTWRAVVMAILVSMGGFIFGYDTGQISGYLQMNDFLYNFGQYNAAKGAYEFTNVRSGLITGLVRPFFLSLSTHHLISID